MAFNIQFASDLHLEYYATDGWNITPNIIKPSAPYLALAGDICTLSGESLTNYRKWLYEVAEGFRNVFVIAGNHEFYESQATFSETKNVLRQMCSDHNENKITFMDKTSIMVDGVRLLGATLWSRVPSYAEAEVSGFLNDYALITPDEKHLSRGYRPPAVVKKAILAQLGEEYEMDLAWLTKEIRDATARNEPIVVMSHHSPKSKLI